MANNFVSNPMIVDTVQATDVVKIAGAGSPPGGWVIDKVIWYNPAAPADTFVISLGDGVTTFLQDYCVTAHQSVQYQMYGFRLADFRVPTLASGTLYIYYR